MQLWFLDYTNVKDTNAYVLTRIIIKVSLLKSNLKKQSFKTCTAFNRNINKLILLLQKGVYPDE